MGADLLLFAVLGGATTSPLEWIHVGSKVSIKLTYFCFNVVFAMVWTSADCLLHKAMSLHHHSAILVCKQVFLIKSSPVSGVVLVVENMGLACRCGGCHEMITWLDNRLISPFGYSSLFCFVHRAPLFARVLSRL